MSRSSPGGAGNTSKDTDNLPIKYEVGYAKPPPEHRFKKGQSGNPRGRPKGARNQPKIDTGFGMRAAEEYLRLEAYRSVTIREGERVIELPAIQAVFRAMGVSAMKGNRFAQRTLAELVTQMEMGEHESRFELFGSAIDYKNHWDEEIERCKKAGLPLPEPLPHPDDIILNPRNGDVRFLGPQTKEQKADYDKLQERREQAQHEVSEFAERYRRARNPKMKQLWLKEWHCEQRLFDIINDGMPARYKMKLEDRSYHAEASREGQTLEGFRKGRLSKERQRK